MALAGTMSCDDDRDEWDQKNREEHALVVDYIASVFREAGLQPVVHGAETVRHGDVRHLRHLITATGSRRPVRPACRPVESYAGVGRMAGCETSIGEIGQVEAHPRYCYGGYISVTDSGGRRSAYVNLRSFHFYGDTFCIYAGGGITGRSDVAGEWREARPRAAVATNIGIV